MKIRRKSTDYNFLGDTDSGITFRWGKTLLDNPLVAPWPELADISISNHCTKGCDYCYRDSKVNESFISLKDYNHILDKLSHPKWGNVFQIAIGGGEPLEHPHLKKIIEATRLRNIIPNLTTNGQLIDDEYARYFKKTVGAMALSVTDITELDINKVQLLLNASVRTNIHYVLSSNNIIQAVEILSGKYNRLLSGLNSIIFLTHKPCGRGNESNVFIMNNDLKKFLGKIEKNDCSIRIGFDACFVPLLLHFTKTDFKYIDSCECGYFSIYIDEKLNVKPCSFDNSKKYTFNLAEYTFEEIWLDKLQMYREEVINKCKRQCSNKDECRGACHYYSEITTCFCASEEAALHV